MITQLVDCVCVESLADEQSAEEIRALVCCKLYNSRSLTCGDISGHGFSKHPQNTLKTPSKHPQQLPHIASPISGRCTSAWATTSQKMACMTTVDPHGSLYSPFYNVCCGSPPR